MSYQQKDNSGSLFKNDRKTEDKHPSYKGSCLINGEEYWISAWVKEKEKDGVKSKHFSLSFTPKEATQGRTTNDRQGNYGNAVNVDDDDLPF